MTSRLATLTRGGGGGFWGKRRVAASKGGKKTQKGARGRAAGEGGHASIPHLKKKSKETCGPPEGLCPLR